MNIVLISCYDRGCSGNRILSSVLKRSGHQVSLVYLKEHRTCIKRHGDTNESVIMHEVVNEAGEDVVLSYGSPISTKEIDLLINLLRNIKPGLIGFSLRSISVDLLKEHMFRIKKSTGTPIIWGGIGPTLEPEKCLRYADIVCIGEGEEAILELADKMERGEDIYSIRNLLFKKGDTLVKNTCRPLIQDLDALPFPDIEPDNKFTIENDCLIAKDERIGNMDKGFYDITTSRGCPFSCSYCCNDFFRKLYQGENYVRRRSVDNVLKELEAAKEKRPIHTVYFKDDVFTYNWNWIKEFCSEYPRRIGTRFWCYTHPLYVKQDNLEALKKAGLYYITMGIESGSENVLFNIFKRKTPKERILQAGKILNELGLKNGARYDLIVNNPFEKDEDCRNTLELLCDMPRPLNIGLSKLSFFPGYLLSEMLNDKLIDEHRNNGKKYLFWNCLYLLTQYKNISKKIIIRFSRSAFLYKHPWFLKQLLLPKKISATKEMIWLKLMSFMPGTLKAHVKRLLKRGGFLPNL